MTLCASRGTKGLRTSFFANRRKRPLHACAQVIGDSYCVIERYLSIATVQATERAISRTQAWRSNADRERNSTTITTDSPRSSVGRRSDSSQGSTATPSQIAIGRERLLKAIPTGNTGRLVRKIEGLPSPIVDEEENEKSPELSSSYYSVDESLVSEFFGSDSEKNWGSDEGEDFEFSARRERTLRDTPIWAIMARCVC